VPSLYLAWCHIRVMTGHSPNPYALADAGLSIEGFHFLGTLGLSIAPKFRGAFERHKKECMGI
jgi:hypothetical protein